MWRAVASPDILRLPSIIFCTLGSLCTPGGTHSPELAAKLSQENLLPPELRPALGSFNMEYTANSKH